MFLAAVLLAAIASAAFAPPAAALLLETVSTAESSSTGASSDLSSYVSNTTQQNRPDPALSGIEVNETSPSRAHRSAQVNRAANRGLRSLWLPRPLPRFSPPAQRSRTLVGVDTWFWVPAHTWRPIVRVVPAGTVVVTLTAAPTALQLLPGDGSPPVTCPGPGLPWAVPGSWSPCSHVFQRASTATSLGRFRGTVQTLWTIRWVSSTGLSGIIGPIPVRTPVSLLAAEAQPVLELAAFHRIGPP